jgi:hypothetical protein
MNELFVTKKERKKERKTANPRGPHDGNRIPTRCLGIPIPQTEDWLKVLSDFRQEAARLGCSLAHVLRLALLEVHETHFPGGNPGPKLDCFFGTEPFSEAAEEKLAPKPLEPDYKHMSVPELEAQLKRRFLSEADCMVIRFWIGKKQQETRTK